MLQKRWKTTGEGRDRDGENAVKLPPGCIFDKKKIRQLEPFWTTEQRLPKYTVALAKKHLNTFQKRRFKTSSSPPPKKIHHSLTCHKKHPKKIISFCPSNALNLSLPTKILEFFFHPTGCQPNQPTKPARVPHVGRIHIGRLQQLHTTRDANVTFGKRVGGREGIFWWILVWISLLFIFFVFLID